MERKLPTPSKLPINKKQSLEKLSLKPRFGNLAQASDVTNYIQCVTNACNKHSMFKAAVTAVRQSHEIQRFAQNSVSFPPRQTALSWWWGLQAPRIPFLGIQRHGAY